MTKILFADDDEGMRVLVARIVEEGGYECVCASDGVEAYQTALDIKPDLIILDVMMPGLDGYAVCGRLRAAGVRTPIILLTARGDIMDKSIGFKLGADDYLVKPFVAQELQLRIEALLRRVNDFGFSGEGPTSDVIRTGDLEINTKKRTVSVAGQPVSLTPKEFHLLMILAGNPGVVFTHDQLIEDIWGKRYEGELTAITVLVYRLRKKIEKDPANPRYIQTVWHVGYRFGDA